MKRPSSLFTKKLLLLVAAVFSLVAGVGYISWRHSSRHQSTLPTTHQPAKPNATKYISLSGSYLFSIPAKYAVDETVIPGVAVVYSKDITTLPVKNLDELYSGGSVTVQPLKQLKNSNAKTFKDYVSNSVAADLRKTMSSGSDVRFSKKGDTDAAEVFAILNSGTHLRVAYLLNLAQPLMSVAKDESDAFKIVGASLEDLNKTNLKPDIDLVFQTAKTVVDMLRRRDGPGLKSKGSTDFKNNITKDQLIANLNSSSSFLDRSITVVGGSYDGDVFIAQLAFEPKTTDKAPVSGVISLSRQGNNWGLDGFQLPQ